MVFHFLAGVKLMNSTSHCFKFQGCRTSYLNPSRITICLRVIRNAWHFRYALRLVFKVVAEASVLRCSHLNRALCL